MHKLQFTTHRFLLFNNNSPECMELDHYFIDPDYMVKAMVKIVGLFIRSFERWMFEILLCGVTLVLKHYKKMGCEKIGVKKSHL
ncbi:MAG: hypothetical protein H0U75_06345 [Legionella sp.]|nr:hypothetical protein [Legionella sp.]